MRTLPHKFSVEKLVIRRVGVRCVRGVYIKVMTWNSITWDSTAQVRYLTCQLVWSVVTQTGLGNHLGINKFY